MKLMPFLSLAAALVTTSCSSLQLPWNKTADAAQQYDPYSQQQYAGYPQQQQQYAYPQQQQPGYAYPQQGQQQQYTYPNYGAQGEQAQVSPAGGNSYAAADYGSGSQGSGGNAVSSGRTYVVQKRDTLSAISRKYNVSVNSLMRANNLSSDLIRVGDRLSIP